MKQTIALLFLSVFSMLSASVLAKDGVKKNITAIGDITRGTDVTLKGRVTRILDEDEFRLQDDTGSVRIYIGWKNQVMVNTGETVKVSGFVDDDLVNTFRPEVYARELVRESGEVIELR